MEHFDLSVEPGRGCISDHSHDIECDAERIIHNIVDLFPDDSTLEQVREYLTEYPLTEKLIQDISDPEAIGSQKELLIICRNCAGLLCAREKFNFE